ncbi:hypothetical protein ACFYY2_21025 [Streptomyces sp. NPDC001822]|uniref:hypothetical protein n=1 Tax=Streptomyces sp. NPDC001822 TaxID=3364614 RepID=UPI0036B9ED1C
MILSRSRSASPAVRPAPRSPPGTGSPSLSPNLWWKARSGPGAHRVARVSEMSFVLFKAGLDLVMPHDGPERTAYTEELKAVIYRYLEPLACDTPGGVTSRGQ